jgi:ribonuclease Z
MRRAVLWIGGVMVTLAALAWLTTLSPSVDVWLYRHAAARLANAPDAVLARPGELSVLMCGTGSPLPDLNRASACTIVAAGERLYVVDVGLASVRNLLLWRVPLAKVDGVLLTHFHSDHIAELGELRLQTWVAGRHAPLKVYGPPGVEDVVDGFNRAYSHDADYRTLHHGEAFLPRADADMVAVPIAMDGATAIVLERDGLKITAIRVHHDPVKPAYGYRFDYAGRSVVVSGDTAPYQPLAQAARNADVLVHEAQSNALVGILEQAMTHADRDRVAKILHDIPGYHSDPVDAARIANQAQVRLLVFSHINPPLPNGIAERAFLRGVAEVRADGWVMAHDGLLIRLPGHSGAIEQSSLP